MTQTPAFCAQIAELLAKSEANKAVNDKKRLATSYANFESSRSPSRLPGGGDSMQSVWCS